MMKTYPLYSMVAFLVDHEVSAYIYLAIDKRNGSIPEEIKALTPEEFAKAARDCTLPCDDYHDTSVAATVDGLFAQYVSDFKGDVTTIRAAMEMATNPIGPSYDEECICYINPEESISPFKRAYESIYELVKEYKHRLREFNLPDDFDWFGHIVNIFGTVYG